MHRRAVRQDAPEHSVQGAGHGNAVYFRGNISHLHLGADIQQPAERTVRRSPEDPFSGEAADEAGNARVGLGAAPIKNPAQIVAPHGFHHGMAVLPRREAGSHADDHRRVGNLGAQVPLGQNGVHHRAGL